MPRLARPTLALLAVFAVIGTVGVMKYNGTPLPWPLSLADPIIALAAEKAGFKQAAAPTAANSTTAPVASGGGARSGGQGPAGRPPVTVVTAKAERKPTPVRLDATGTVQTLSTVTIKARVDSQIIDVPVQDGGMVNKGDVLFKLDSRQIEALIKQAEANISKDKSTLIQVEADLVRAEALAKRDFATDQRLETARALVGSTRATIRANEAFLENLNVQLTFYTITAPISGRVGITALKAGNIAKQGDSSASLTTINQITPIYVSFALPQRHLPEIREAMATGAGKVMATPQGFAKAAEGKLAVIDNTVDATTGTIPMRAVFDNPGELLWPGALCQVRVILRIEDDALVVPREAIQTGQNGTYLFTVSDGIARSKPVVVDRIVDNVAVLKSGIEGGETVVVDGQLILTDGARVVERGSARPGTPRPATTSQAGGQG